MFEISVMQHVSKALPCTNVSLGCAGLTSVSSDDYDGAQQFTKLLLIRDGPLHWQACKGYS